MKIVVISRTLNEAGNVPEFCTHYGFADHILITDGGSTDGTRQLAATFPNVEIIDTSHLRREINGVVVTPESDQTNIAIRRALELGADWLIRDDIDCWPNPALSHNARSILEETLEDSVFLYRLYIYGRDRYFPKMNVPGRSLWAWKQDKVHLYCEEGHPLWGWLRNVPDSGHNLDYPFVCLHYFAPDEATIQRKMERYKAMGSPMDHPAHGIYAPPEPLPGWVLKDYVVH